MHKLISILFLSAIISSPAMATDFEIDLQEVDPIESPEDSGLDDFTRNPFQKVAGFSVDRCYAADGRLLHADLLDYGAYVNYCDKKVAKPIFDKAMKQKNNFANGKYVLYMHRYKDYKGFYVHNWFALDKATKKVAILPVDGGYGENDHQQPKFTTKGNRLCITTGGKDNYLLGWGSDTGAFEPNVGNKACFVLKSDKKGHYWSHNL